MAHSLRMAREYLGKAVEIAIDRPKGSRHPQHSFLYEENYGYVDGTVSPDGEGLDAYYPGEAGESSKASGLCIAIIHRLDDDDDKLVVVPGGVSLTDEEILERVGFQKQWHECEVVRQ